MSGRKSLRNVLTIKRVNWQRAIFREGHFLVAESSTEQATPENSAIRLAGYVLQQLQTLAHRELVVLSTLIGRQVQHTNAEQFCGPIVCYLVTFLIVLRKCGKVIKCCLADSCLSTA